MWISYMIEIGLTRIQFQTSFKVEIMKIVRIPVRVASLI